MSTPDQRLMDLGQKIIGMTFEATLIWRKM